MMKRTILYIIRRALGVAAALPVIMCASCSDDDSLESAAVAGDMVNVEITIRTASMTATRSDGYVQGTGYENYIDIENGDYRVYFFTNSAGDGNDTYMAGFSLLHMQAVENNDYTEYTLDGEVEAGDIIDAGSFKIMVLANWGKDNYPTVTGETTIDDVCGDAAGVYNAFVDESGNACAPSASHLIPFYGIHAYTDVSLVKGEQVVLTQAVTLLRAVAKVEVVLKNSDRTLSDVSIQRYNEKGYCAPAGVYSESYYESADRQTSSFSGVHLLNDANDEGASGRSLPFMQQDDGTWVIYVPEYNNTASVDDYAYITLKEQNDDDTSYTIYFANYAYGETVNDDVDYRFDIQRNNLYRYTVEFLDNQGLNVHVDKWSEEYENKYEFGVEEEEEAG